MPNNSNSIDVSSMLKTGSILHGTYRIEGYLSSGGFGNTYVVTHINLHKRMALKEFFMKDVSERQDNQSSVKVSNSGKLMEFNEQREKFCKEARRLCDLNNPHIVKVYDLFDENDTSYYVMDYIDGENLKDKIKRDGKPLSEAIALDVLKQVLDALNTVHSQGLWHMDIKPANIMMDKNGQVKLIDFGASKQLDYSKGGAVSTSAVSYTKGYAPIEQMNMNYDKFGPWTDFYALGATLYNLLTGDCPPSPSDVLEDNTPDKHISLPFKSNISTMMRGLIRWMMKPSRNERPQSVNDIFNYLNKYTGKPGANQPPQPPQPPIGQTVTIVKSPHQGGMQPPIAAAMKPPLAPSQPNRPAKPNSNLVWAILSTLLCCIPIGIFAIINANRVDSLYNSGDYDGAQKAAEKVKNLSLCSAIVGLIAWIIAIIILANYDTTDYSTYNYDDYYGDSLVVDTVPDDYYGLDGEVYDSAAYADSSSYW